jgi:predicted nucleic acid-binding protein
LDASALVKLVVTEPESESLKRELARWRERATASISLTEVLRACRVAAAANVSREIEGPMVKEAQAVLAGVAMLDADPPLLREAGLLDPVGLRSLDAVHLAAALSFGTELGALVTYDLRLAVAAKQHRLQVLTPT